MSKKRYDSTSSFKAPSRALSFVILLSTHQIIAYADDIETLPSLVVQGETITQLNKAASTGSYLGLTPLETPASIDVITREAIEQRGDTKLVDVISRSTGMTGIGHNGNGGQDLSSRGFTGVNSVIRLYDGTRQYGGAVLSFPFDTWSVDRVEVLHGPSSVIYGDGGIGGVVNVIPKKPSRGDIKNEVKLTVGTDDTRRIGLGSGGAINDRIAYRADLSADKSNGWIDNGDSENITFTGALLFDLTDNLDMKLSYARGKQEPVRYFGTPLVNGQQIKALRGNNYNVEDSKIQFDDQWAELAFNWQASENTNATSKFYNIESKRDWRNTEQYLYNSVSGLIDRDGQTQISHDQSTFGNTSSLSNANVIFGLKNKTSVGFDISTTTFQHTNNGYTGASSSVDLYHPQSGSYIYSNSPSFIPKYRNKAEQYSLFMEDQLSLSDQLSVVAGIRYDHAKVTRKDLTTNQQTLDTTFNNIGWRLGSVFKFTPSFSIYGQYTEAADPVGSMISISNPDLDLSKGTQYEVGLKKTFWNESAEWTVAVFDIEKKDLLTRSPINPSLRVQVGQQSSRGIEATLALPIAKDWYFDGNLAVLDAQYDSFTDNVGGSAISRKGNVPTDVPERVANANFSWNFLPNWTASSTTRYVGKRYADNANSLKLPSYTVSDLSLHWSATADTRVTIRAANLFDKYYFTTSYYEETQWLYGPERSFELSVHHSF